MASSLTELINYVKTLPDKPGVYQMKDASGKIIYVGKARNLRKRVGSYFSGKLDTKTQVMIAKVVAIEIIVTTSENEALLLEANLIKEFKPRYNVLLRDDKSYPYLYLSTDQTFPRLDFYRGSKKGRGKYFGPYPSAGSVRENLALIQKLFKLRQCRDTFFANRTRPCLQYQIKRCTAPCVGLVSEQDYQAQVQHAIYFLQGKNDRIIEALSSQMQHASDDKCYEEAARFRDQIVQLRQLQKQQSIIGDNGNIDIIGVAEQLGHVAISVMQVRGGRLLGKRVYFPKIPAQASKNEVLSSFIPQYYLNSLRRHDLPNRVVFSEKLEDRLWIQQALQSQLDVKIHLSDRKLESSRQWQKMAELNATQALAEYVGQKAQVSAKLSELAKLLNCPNALQRIECFDISHTQGNATVASCVVYTEVGASKKDYRKYNIKGITPGDDYAAMYQALTRRYTRLKEAEEPLPDLLIIDGGKGQLAQAVKVFEELQVSGVILLGVAKGPERKAGKELLWLNGKEEAIVLPENNLAFHLIQFVRDEAHRFAITAHRAKRAKQSQRSKLEEIDGIGDVRRQQLLKYFGGLQGLKRASVEEIARVPGISESLAEKIHSFLHGT